MALTDTKATVIQVVNEVQRRLALRTTTSADSTSHARVLVDLLNDVVDEIADIGDWVQLRGSANVTAVSGQAVYTVPVSGTSESIHHIEEVRISGRVPPLEVFNDVSEFRALNSLTSTGKPVRFAVVGEDGKGNPNFGVWPKPGAAEAGNVMAVHFYYKPRKYVAGSDENEIVPVPARMVVAGVHAKAILDENGGARTPQFETVYAEYERMKKQALNRFNSDTGGLLRFIPGRS